jgi:8-oxo-dGTP pyrophosphatase MutT (NUDIX family)
MMSDYIHGIRCKVGNDLLVMPSTAVAVRDERGRLLLGRHHNGGVWVLPGGLIEPGELPADAAMREVWEETGLIVRLERIIGVFGGPELNVKYSNGDLASYVGTIFAGESIGGELRPDGEEILEVRYFERSEIENIPQRSWMKMVLPFIFEPAGTTYFQPGSWKLES